MSIDDHETVVALDAAREVFQSGVVLQGGRVIDMAGDSVLAVFDTAAGAVRAAIDIQAELSGRAEGLPSDRQMRFRVGVHLGDVIEKPDGTVYGDGVNVASRLQALAQPGSIVVSQAIQNAVGARARAGFVDLGEHAVKNISQPVRAFSCAGSPPNGDISPASADAYVTAHESPAPLSAGRRRTVAIFAATLLVLLAIGAGGFAIQHLKPATDPVPYSATDRRMTFAVLPVETPSGDLPGERLAHSIGETVQSEEEARSVWARVVPRAQVLQAVARPGTFQQIGITLNAHFLLRPSVSRSATGYGAAIALVDAQTEHVIDTFPLEIEPGPEPKAKRSSLDNAVSLATYRALRHEVAGARSKRDARLDVRDLAMRAYSDWGNRGTDGPKAYALAQHSIERALALSSDDLLTLRVAAEVNLCECVRPWASGTRREEMVKFGSKALDHYLELSPNTTYMLFLRSRLLFERKHFYEAIAVADDILQHDPQYAPALRLKASALYESRQLPEALDATQAALAVVDDVDMNSLALRIRFAMRDDTAAIRHATKAISKLPSRTFEEPSDALILIYLAAAQARSGNGARAKAALDDFFVAVPSARSMTQINSWLEKLSVRDPELLAGLRLAGVGD